jgi:aryl-phospho-beta-D-glucosidase BglC (GH1 family)
MQRRNFLAAAATMPAALAEVSPQNPLPRWRGFNLLDLFQALPKEPDSRAQFVRKEECRWIRDWGFNFIRIPLDYWSWIDSDWRATRKLTPDDTFKIRESALEPIDNIVEYGQKYGLHVSLNLHRAPGYCINNPEREPFVLWSDPRAEEAFKFHWQYFAKRYQSISNYTLSFNLLNEAPTPKDGYMTREDYARVMLGATNTIRAVSPTRTIIIDGLSVGNQVVDEMIFSGVAQSVHAYSPPGISHYRASWVDKKLDFPDPTWPLMNAGGSFRYSRANLEKHYEPWGELARKGIGVHCGEAGCFNKTPQPVFLAWMEDVLDILQKHGIGWALWNFRGSFGMLDSGRADADYQEWYGRKVDRKLLALLQRY